MCLRIFKMFTTALLIAIATAVAQKATETTENPSSDSPMTEADGAVKTNIAVTALTDDDVTTTETNGNTTTLAKSDVTTDGNAQICFLDTCDKSTGVDKMVLSANKEDVEGRLFPCLSPGLECFFMVETSPEGCRIFRLWQTLVGLELPDCEEFAEEYEITVAGYVRRESVGALPAADPTKWPTDLIIFPPGSGGLKRCSWSQWSVYGSLGVLFIFYMGLF